MRLLRNIVMTPFLALFFCVSGAMLGVLYVLAWLEDSWSATERKYYENWEKKPGD